MASNELEVAIGIKSFFKKITALIMRILFFEEHFLIYLLHRIYKKIFIEQGSLKMIAEIF